MNEPIVSRILRAALYGIFATGVVLVVTLPFMLDIYLGFLRDSYSAEPGYRTFILIFLTGAGIPGLWVVFEMIRMLRTIRDGPFVARNVRALNRTGCVFLALAAAFLGKCLLYVTIMTLLCGILFIVCGLFAFTLGHLFRQAVAFREENDLTI